MELARVRTLTAVSVGFTTEALLISWTGTETLSPGAVTMLPSPQAASDAATAAQVRMEERERGIVMVSGVAKGLVVS